jgi:hypothetical protein
MTFKLQVLNLLKPLAIITIIVYIYIVYIICVYIYTILYSYTISVFTVYIRVKYRGQVVSNLGLIPEVVNFLSASSQIPR